MRLVRKSRVIARKKNLEELLQLGSVGKAVLNDFKLLGITSVRQLVNCNPRRLYMRLWKLTGKRPDPCCEDVFSAAIAQSKNKNLPKEQKQWWYWSRLRKKKLYEK